MPEEHSFLTVQGDNVVLTAAKKAEDDNAVLLRFYEWAGKEGDITLHPDTPVAEASETDLMERSIQPVKSKDGDLVVHTKPYEIKTVKVQLGKAGKGGQL